MDTASANPEQQVLSSADLPPIPYHIIVTFDGKVREMLRITRDSADEDRREKPRSRSRYYAGDNEPRLEMD
ncbi:hypothetical protein BKA66DRAFT_465873 [Pyrenochaeta sp. MPI-SDFR-AT-0127]|nr:hypothetical protein BKA66DRAFT_465873 [Pyrenochaeta sp. MPI-SDFR-AT-0127]